MAWVRLRHVLYSTKICIIYPKKGNIHISFSALKKPLAKLWYLVKLTKYYEFKMWFGKCLGVKEECTGKNKEKNLTSDVSHNRKPSHNQSNEECKGHHCSIPKHVNFGLWMLHLQETSSFLKKKPLVLIPCFDTSRYYFFKRSFFAL